LQRLIKNHDEFLGAGGRLDKVAKKYLFLGGRGVDMKKGKRKIENAKEKRMVKEIFEKKEIKKGAFQ
jgi:hypothetical protein